MDIYRVIIVITVVVTTGCTAPDKKPDPCKSEYANTVSHCRKRIPIKQDLVLVCEMRGGFKTCVYIPRHELRDIIRGMARP